MADDENAKIELEDRGEEGEGYGPRPDGEEVPQHLGNHGLVGHGQLVVTGVPENLLVGGNHPGQGDQRGWGRQTCRNIQIKMSIHKYALRNLTFHMFAEWSRHWREINKLFYDSNIIITPWNFTWTWTEPGPAEVRWSLACSGNTEALLQAPRAEFSTLNIHAC